MLRVAATLLALLAAIPAVAPLIGGYKAYSECRNLTQLGPSAEWPAFSSRTYNYTGLLVMPGDTCSGSLVTTTVMLSCSLCRFWKDNVNFENDIEDAGSEVRIGLIQGDVPRDLYQHELVKQYLHWGKTRVRVQKDPVMLVVVEEPFSWSADQTLPGILRHTPLSEKDPISSAMMSEIVGYENTVNAPIYHQSSFDARLFIYSKYRNDYGRTIWNLSDQALCTWDVSPVRTVCSMDRGGPVLSKRNILGVIIGIVDDIETPGNHCGEGRIYYNIFLQLDKYAQWIKDKTEGDVIIMDVNDGKLIEVCDGDDGITTLKPAGRPPRPRPPTTKRPRRKSGSDRQMVSVGPLLFSVAVNVGLLVIQY